MTRTQSALPAQPERVPFRERARRTSGCTVNGFRSTRKGGRSGRLERTSTVSYRYYGVPVVPFARAPQPSKLRCLLAVQELTPKIRKLPPAEEDAFASLIGPAKLTLPQILELRVFAFLAMKVLVGTNTWGRAPTI